MVSGTSINSRLAVSLAKQGFAAAAALLAGLSAVGRSSYILGTERGGGQTKLLQALTRHPPTSLHLQMLSWTAMLLGGLLITVATVTVAQYKGQEAGGRRRAHRVQHGQCSYTFVLPEPESCPPEPETFRGSNSLQRDSPATALNLGDWPTQRVQQLEKVLENNTQWLQKVSAGPAEVDSGQ